MKRYIFHLSDDFYNSIYRELPYAEGHLHIGERSRRIFPADGKLMPTPRGKHQLSPTRPEVNSQRASVTALRVSTNRGLVFVERDKKRGREREREGLDYSFCRLFSFKTFNFKNICHDECTVAILLSSASNIPVIGS